MVLENFQERYTFDERLSLHEAGRDDIDAVAAVLSASFNDPEPLVTANLLKRFAQDARPRIYLATFGEGELSCQEPVGTLRLDEFDGVIGIYGFGVVPDYRETWLWSSDAGGDDPHDTCHQPANRSCSMWRRTTLPPSDSIRPVVFASKQHMTIIMYPRRGKIMLFQKINWIWAKTKFIPCGKFGVGASPCVRPRTRFTLVRQHEGAPASNEGARKVTPLRQFHCFPWHDGFLFLNGIIAPIVRAALTPPVELSQSLSHEIII